MTGLWQSRRTGAAAAAAAAEGSVGHATGHEARLEGLLG